MNIKQRLARLERLKPGIDYIEEGKKFVQWVNDNGLMASRECRLVGGPKAFLAVPVISPEEWHEMAGVKPDTP